MVMVLSLKSNMAQVVSEQQPELRVLEVSHLCFLFYGVNWILELAII